MTTATATTEGQEDLTGTEQVQEEGRTPTESILTGQEGDEAADPKEVEDAIAAGYARAKGTAAAGKGDGADEEDITDTVLNQRTDDGNGNPAGGQGTGAAGNGTPSATDDPEIPGLGMKASEVKAHLAELGTLKKTAASLAGSLGHLKQVVTSAGQGKKVTADQLSRVREEFGDDFAGALADDLNAAGFGGGSAVDPTAIQQMVNEQVQAARVAEERKFEKKLVLRAHPDADEHFSSPILDDKGAVTGWKPGPKHEAFMSFVKSLPADRQQQLFGESGWDSAVVTRALDDFKAHEKKAANQQATQTARMKRAVVPNTGSGRDVQQPAADPVMQGWNNVRGKRAVAPAGAGGRGR